MPTRKENASQNHFKCTKRSGPEVGDTSRNFLGARGGSEQFKEGRRRVNQSAAPCCFNPTVTLKRSSWLCTFGLGRNRWKTNQKLGQRRADIKMGCIMWPKILEPGLLAFLPSGTHRKLPGDASKAPLRRTPEEAPETPSGAPRGGPQGTQKEPQKEPRGTFPGEVVGGHFLYYFNKQRDLSGVPRGTSRNLPGRGGWGPLSVLL